MNKKQRKMLTRIIIVAIAFVCLKLLTITPVVSVVLYMAAYFVIGYDILIKAAKGIIHGQMFDENFLMALATVGAIALAIYEKSGDLDEAIAVMLFYQIGELFQSYAVGKSRKSITELMDIRPDYANVEIISADCRMQEGQEITGGVNPHGDAEGQNSLVSLQKVDPDEVTVGSIIVVQPGEKVPIDGIVEEGTSSLNTGALTGESIPRDVKTGDEVISGCINNTGVLRIKTTKEFGESTVSKILELVEDAGSRKSKSENFISKFARIYTPAVVFAALALALLPPVISIISASPAEWHIWLYRALIFLVISCPCALVISIPLTFFAGIGGASHQGILIKGSNYLETFSKVKTVVFDKTGTLTQGVFKVSEIHSEGISEAQLIEYAALAECSSSHPISKSLKEAYGKEPDRNRVKDIEEISGHGVLAAIDGKQVAAGNMRLMQRQGVEFMQGQETASGIIETVSDIAEADGTVVYLAVDGRYVGHVVISDTPKPTSAEAVSGLKKAGILKTVMLTGDSRAAAEKVAGQLGIDEFHSQLLPGDKVNKVEELLEETSGNGKLAFVGDGINDAPVLSRADIGIAMGAMGSDAAIEAADVVLMDDDPMKILRGIKISRKCLRIVYQNIVFALVIKFACLGLGAVGIANMWVAIFADVGVMVIAVINAIRALR